MKSNYRKIGDFIQLVDERNTDLNINLLLGLSINKVFIPSVANIVGTNMANYKIIRKNQFSCSLMQVRRDKKIPVALLKDYDEAIISQAYPVFKISDTEELLPDYLMMWMSRSEFDREACFNAVGGVRGSLEWEDFCNMELPVPSPEKQQEIVDEYNTVVNRIKLNEDLNRKLEETAQTLYRHWFVDFEFPISKEYAETMGKPELEGKPYKSSGGEMVYSEQVKRDLPSKWASPKIESIIRLNYGKSLPSNKRIPGPFKVYSSSGISGWHNEPLIQEDCIIVGRKGSIGTLYMERDPCYCIDTAYYILDSEINVPLHFAYWLLRQLNLPSMNEDSAVPGLSRKTVYDKNVIVPNEMILWNFEKIVKVIDDNIVLNNSEIQKLNKIQYIILAKMTVPSKILV
ncbi:restriction endonuclease subunit S [Salegentibacter mishustinae]|uniref:restriction endonuclease subunit S n=1 Tax=Salegentibacter mishustinae TaxID=270918 RepID=UPI0024919606|nr:restriction endonuclease subunit S [Salegentibacter mishustinae]